jgi:predicted house-cleaning noncanonical NTP pyrophosphatase (MazG superfamily)
MLLLLDFGMKKIHYNKLIRDKIPEKMTKSGAAFKIKHLASKQYKKELLKKVFEESDGLVAARNRDELTSELADVLEVLEEIRKFNKIKPSCIRDARVKNMQRKGGFNKRLFLYWAEDTGYRSNERRYKK